MTTVFIICAALGGTVLVIQFIMALIGLGGDMLDMDVSADVGHDIGGGDFHGDLGGGDLHGGDFHTDHGGDSHAHDATTHGSTWLFAVVSFRTVVAALAFFGLAGLWAQASDFSDPMVLLVAAAAGVLAMFLVYWLMLGLTKLQAEGNVRIQRAVGQRGTVYLRVPGNRSGTGKIQFNLQNRTMEYLAVTAGEELPTGTKVIVVGVVDPTTLEVRAE
jgi:membrane protein implicated in regulation of membrane protease activity